MLNTRYVVCHYKECLRKVNPKVRLIFHCLEHTLSEVLDKPNKHRHPTQDGNHSVNRNRKPSLVLVTFFVCSCCYVSDTNRPQYFPQ